MKWLWNCKCGKCGYRSEFYKWQWASRLFAFWHSVTQHPFGYCHIEAVDAVMYKKNRACVVSIEARLATLESAMHQLQETGYLD